MNNNVKEFVLEYLQREYTIECDDIMNLNYMETGYVDSIGLIGFVATLEDEFGIEFSEEDMESPDFKVVGKLIELISQKL